MLFSNRPNNVRTKISLIKEAKIFCNLSEFILGTWTVLNRPPTKSTYDTRSFYCGEPCTNWDSHAADPKHGWSRWHSSFGVPQALCKKNSALDKMYRHGGRLPKTRRSIFNRLSGTNVRVYSSLPHNRLGLTQDLFYSGDLREGEVGHLPRLVSRWTTLVIGSCGAMCIFLALLSLPTWMPGWMMKHGCLVECGTWIVFNTVKRSLLK